MLSKYTAGLNEQEQAEVVAEYTSALNFRKRLTKILEKQVETDFQAMLNEEVFDANNQIERVARIKATKKVINLLK